MPDVARPHLPTCPTSTSSAPGPGDAPVVRRGRLRRALALGVLGTGEPDPAGRPRRHAGDVVRVVVGTSVLAGSVAAARQDHLGRWEINLFRLLNELPSALAVPLTVLMQAGTLAAVAAATALALLARRRRLGRDLVTAGALAWLGARALKAVVGRGRPATLLPDVLIRGASPPGLGFPSGHVAVAAALATAAAPHLSRRARRLAWCGVAVVAAARMYVGAHLPLDTTGGAALGWAMASALHLVWGAPGRRPTLAAVREGLARAGIEVARLEPATTDARGSTPYSAHDRDGQPLFVKVVGRDERDADWLFRAWRYLAYREPGDESPFATPKQLVEHEAYVSLLAARAGVRTPELLASGVLADGSGFLVWRSVEGEVLGSGSHEPSDAHLVDLWQQVGRLHTARIAHRDLRRANIVVDASGRPWVLDFGFSEASAADRLLAQDIAELLVSSAVIVGAERAVAAARRAVPDEVLAAAFPFVQPLALSHATRSDVRAHPGLLADLRHLLAESLGIQPEPPLEPLTRVRLRTLAALVVGAVAVHLLVPQVAELRQSFDAISRARWWWLVPAALASAFTYLMAAVGVIAASQRPLPLGRTVMAQLAASVANRLAPSGIGAMGANLRYLERSGLRRPAAVAALTVTTAAGAAVHAVALLACSVAVAGAGVPAARLPQRWGLAVATAGVAVAAGAVLRSRVGRQRLLPPVREAARSLGALVRRPAQAALVFGAAVGVTAGYVLALALSLRAFGAHPALVHVAVAYLAGAVVGSVSPTPGGLGALEAALVAGLTRLGVAAGPAVAGVLAFRLLTYWAPILPGSVALRWLRRHQGL